MNLSNYKIRVKNLEKHFDTRPGMFKEKRIVHAVDGVSFDIKKQEIVGLAGESGCGKTTVGLTLLSLIKPTAGEVHFNGRDIFKLPEKEIRSIRRRIQMIFQDPFSSLNPRMTVHDIIREGLDIHRVADRRTRENMVVELLQKVRLPNYYLNKYPHELSGGEKQRVNIARALILRPEFVVADEPVSKLDVSVRGQILNLILDLYHEMGLSILFISHDLSVIGQICDRVIVMYLGKIVEVGSVETIFGNPAHPYVKALISAIPEPNPRIKTKRLLLKGSPPSPINPPLGCRFHTRCPDAQSICKEIEPSLENLVSRGDHKAACHLLGEKIKKKGDKDQHWKTKKRKMN